MTTITTKLTGKEAATFAQLRSSHDHPSTSMLITKMAISADEDFPNLPIFLSGCLWSCSQGSLPQWRLEGGQYGIRHVQCPLPTWPENIKIQIKI